VDKERILLKKGETGKCFLDSEKLSEIGENLKQGGNASLALEGWTPLNIGLVRVLSPNAQNTVLSQLLLPQLAFASLSVSTLSTIHLICLTLRLLTLYISMLY